MEKVSIDKIKIGKYRVRTSFDEEALQALVRSVKRRGVLYPLVVKKLSDGYFELIAGERRFRAAKEVGLKEVPVIVREKVAKDNGFMEMGIENIQREDLSYYEKGRWVQEMKDLGWTITALAEETGIPQQNLSNWLGFFEESERIKKSSPTVGEEFKPETMPLRTLLHVKTAPISEEKKTELIVEASKMLERPSVTEIQRATRLIEQEPTLKATEAIERARGITLLVPIPIDLMPKLRDYATESNQSIQDTIIDILRLHFD